MTDRRLPAYGQGMYEDAFEWPCDLRIAHGPHVLVTEEIHDAGGRLLATHAEDCPGVGAHPDTMIGRVHSVKEQRT